MCAEVYTWIISFHHPTAMDTVGTTIPFYKQGTDSQRTHLNNSLFRQQQVCIQVLHRSLAYHKCPLPEGLWV